MVMGLGLWVSRELGVWEFGPLAFEDLEEGLGIGALLEAMWLSWKT